MDKDIKRDLAIGIAAMIFVVWSAMLVYTHPQWFRSFEPIRVYPQRLTMSAMELSDNIEDRRCNTPFEAHAQLVFRKALIHTWAIP